MSLPLQQHPKQPAPLASFASQPKPSPPPQAEAITAAADRHRSKRTKPDAEPSLLSHVGSALGLFTRAPTAREKRDLVNELAKHTDCDKTKCTTLLSQANWDMPSAVRLCELGV